MTFIIISRKLKFGFSLENFLECCMECFENSSSFLFLLFLNFLKYSESFGLLEPLAFLDLECTLSKILQKPFKIFYRFF